MAITAEKLEKLLERKGISATVRAYSSVAFDPSTSRSSRISTDYIVKVIPPYKNIEKYKPATLITTGKGMTGIANKDLEFEVEVGLVLVIYNKGWTVTGFIPISNNTGVVFYLMEIESG